MLLNLVTLEGVRQHDATISHAVIAGWTGRDRAAMEKHIAELEALGVPRPAATPMYYRVAAARLTTAPRIEVCGTDSSGEVEFVMLRIDGRLWVGIGSDHTDRKVETMGVAISKQLCEKPVGTDWWLFDDVAAHWDELLLRAYIVENGQRVLYQEGPVTAMRDPRDLIAGHAGAGGVLPEGAVMFCGTLAARGGIRFSPRFEFELHDPVLGRTLRHAYDIEALPVAG
ncbi:hypothetical protein CDO44_14920 [Pigmentiphaga sp. NML080357]|uniref:DUF2848 domain-containing protein n=1 Tax=Pigmentiphaga sp. NML080357 TaxID=2008675 RepID=UPI000B40C4CC|nr:DUF2848 domain-containing protein [Pigmentiphaga sp. NML080357]OVZ58275.1 hypothetical protein CDO44_14920 [Pigmentiphaga sp. NML080357]